MRKVRREQPTAKELSRRIGDFVLRSADGFFARFCPQGRIPRVVAGYDNFPGTVSMALRLATLLRRLDAATVAGMPADAYCAALLRTVDAKQFKMWWSLFIGEALVAFGTPADRNPLLAALSESERTEVLKALDTTAPVDLAAGVLNGYPNNYWLVVARAEMARRQLGLLTDERVLDLSLEKARLVNTSSPLGYMDDHHQGEGRYDLYMMHALSATESVLQQWPADDVARMTNALGRLVLAGAHPNGGAVLWGRSGGFSSVLGTVHAAAALILHWKPRQRARLLGLAANAAQRAMEDWWRDDAVASHRHGMTHWYLGPFRLMETSLGMLCSLAESALLLREAAARWPDLRATADAAELFPEQSEWIAFDPRGPGVWCYRRGRLAFQLPLTDGYTADYAAAPVYPGLFEQVSDKGMPCGVPVVSVKGKRYLPLRRPGDVLFSPPAQLRWTTRRWTRYQDWDWWKPCEDIEGERQVALRVEGDSLVAEERWVFPETPDSVALWFGESQTPLAVQWSCPHPHQACSVAVEGMPEWRSHWMPIRTVHQIDLEPAREMTLGYRVGPA